MKLKSGMEKDYIEYKKNNEDPYENAVVQYAERWADLMEANMSEGAKLSEIADKASHTADISGITGYMHGCAVSSLVHFWEYGEELQKWHNSQYGEQGKKATEENKIINPAILTIGE